MALNCGPRIRFSKVVKWSFSASPGLLRRCATNTDLPGFLDNLDQFKAQGVEEIAVTGVNDVFVMEAWAKSAGADGKISFLADGNGDFARALGLSLDLNARGLGIRSQRYAMIVDNGVVRKLNVEAAPGQVEASSAETLLKQL